MFQGEFGVPKDQFDFVALAEFNRGNIEKGGDRAKLLTVPNTLSPSF